MGNRITKEQAVELVQQYLDYQNTKLGIHVFKDPVYVKWQKKLCVFCLIKYWKFKKIADQKMIEEYVEPDKWVDSPVFEIIVEEYIKDIELCWSIPFCSKQFYETKNYKYGSIGGGPIFVDKEDGEMYQTGSAPIDWLESFVRFKSGNMKGESLKWEPMDKSKFVD